MKGIRGLGRKSWFSSLEEYCVHNQAAEQESFQNSQIRAGGSHVEIAGSFSVEIVSKEHTSDLVSPAP